MARGNLLFTGRRYEPYMALTLVAAEGNPISSPHALRPAEESFNTPADDDADQETVTWPEPFTDIQKLHSLILPVSR